MVTVSVSDEGLQDLGPSVRFDAVLYVVPAEREVRFGFGHAEHQVVSEQRYILLGKVIIQLASAASHK